MEEDNSKSKSGRENLASDLLKMLEKGSKNDVTIVCMDGELKANRDILVARSEYFATMFSNENFVEGQTERIEMKTVFKDSMSLALEWLFSGSINTEKYLGLPTTVLTLDLLRLLMLNDAFSFLETYALDMMSKLDAVAVNLVNGVQDKPTLLSIFCNEVLVTAYLTDDLKFESMFSRVLGIICSHLNLFNEACETRKEEVNSFKYTLAHLSFAMVRKIMEHSNGKHSWKIKTFDLWFSANKETLTKREKVEILEFFKDFVCKRLNEETNQ